MQLTTSFLLLSVFFLPISADCFSYYSQYGQDRFVHENYFKDKIGGVFVDIGAHDGITINNTFFFEQQLGWYGICVEPLPEIFQKLKQNRKAICIQGCASDRSGNSQFFKIAKTKATDPNYHIEMLSGLQNKYDPQHKARIQREVAEHNAECEVIEVPCFTCNELFEKYGLKHINFLSIDTEGGEFDIISHIDFDRYEIDVITVEDNYDDGRFVTFLEGKGFKLAKKQDCDLFFVNDKLSQNQIAQLASP